MSNLKLLYFSFFLLSILSGGGVHAACSSYQGKVVINEYNYIDNWIELKVLDSSAVTSSSNFAGWTLTVFKQSPSTSTTKNVGTAYTTVTQNTCDSAINQTYIQIPFSAANLDNDVNVVLADAGNNIVDVLRIDQSALATYYSGFNACAIAFNNMTDAPLTGSSGHKDIGRLPDGTGPWTISNGTGAGSQQSLCTSNDALFLLTKTPSSSSVDVGSANTFTWTIVVRNGGTTGDLSNSTVTDTLPANMFLSACPAGATCAGIAGAYTGFSQNVGTLTPGASATIIATAYVTAAGAYTNTAQATATELAPGYTQASGTVTAVSVPHHIRLDHAGSGITCMGSSVTVNACNSVDSGGACTANTSGLSGNIIARNAGGAVLVTVPFNIVAGSSSTTVTVPVTSPQTVTFETSGLSVTPTNTWTCWNGSAASCSHVYNDSGFVFDVPDHVSETLQTVSVSAVRKSDNSLACTPAFSGVSKNVTFVCGYSNPATGTLPVRVEGSALNAGNNMAAACDAGGRTVSLAFNASGVASTTFQYADVGNMSLAATYIGAGSDAGLVMTGNDTFIAAPDNFAFSAITAGLIKAWNPFGATVTAQNASGAATPNFGNEAAAEGATLAPNLVSPVGGNNPGIANNIIPGGAFANGAATVNNLSWGEVGLITMTASLTSGNYLGSALTASGTSANIGRFIPDHFDTVTSGGMPCPSGLTCPTQFNGFVYSGQAFTTQVTARNLAGATTLNYDSALGYSKAVALSAWDTAGGATPTPGGGTLNPNAVPSTAFNLGAATTATPAYTFPATPVSPTDIYIRAEESPGGDGVTSLRVPANTSTEGGMKIVSGRFKIPNAYGSELLPLLLTATVQYWNGTGWVTSTTDHATAFNTNLSTGGGNVVATIINGLASGVSVTGAGAATVTAGVKTFTLGNPGVTGSADISLNAPSYLLSGSNMGGVNPSVAGRTTFGVYRGSNDFIYLRESY